MHMKILITDDDRNLRKVLMHELAEQGLEVHEAENGLKTMKLLKKDEYDVLLLDLNMPDIGGMDVLKELKDEEITTEVVILTAHATVASAVNAMKMGAYDYLTKPFEVEELLAVIEKAYEHKRLLNENLILKSQIKRQSATKKIVTQSPIMIELL